MKITNWASLTSSTMGSIRKRWSFHNRMIDPSMVRRSVDAIQVHSHIRSVQPINTISSYSIQRGANHHPSKSSIQNTDLYLKTKSQSGSEEPALQNSRPVKTDYKQPHKVEVMKRKQDEVEKTFKIPKILFKNEKVIVIDKPSGCGLHSQEGSESFIRWNLIIDHLENRFGKLFPVHRLDKGTSGAMILARSPIISRTLTNQFKNHQVKKTYLAVVQFLNHQEYNHLKIGPIQEGKNSGRIECMVRNRNDRMVIAEANRTESDSKQAITEWELVTATSNHAIIRLKPKTGRKHQLRLHCARFLGAPIVGDFKYDFTFLSRQSEKAIKHYLNRQSTGRVLLHCSELEFKLYRKEHPKQYSVLVQSSIHDDFRIVCDQLDLSTGSL
ncbi:hypothetical protein O181_051678 [Austropuccinia psidii MF-1]|uniref:21S rRNA pseudouridine(2819) synthase n=1 Tax=Austropuccinia psidii MF-1 TaxID=1389203 RepID=A0A9Q3E439_9BASI|nr:hypothetical protein [Austropuccinia psidii MF-1]